MSGLTRFIHRGALKVEKFYDRAFGRNGQGRVIDPYIGYATPVGLVLRGRVLSKLTQRTATEQQRVFTNIRHMAALFFTDEVAGVVVKAGAGRATSDEEGYFTLTVPRPKDPGWHHIEISIEGFDDTTTCMALVPRDDARFMVISDIDDTVLQTGAYALWKNLWTSFSGNALTRRIFPDARKLMARLSDDGRNPVFYVSSSPWNFHAFLVQIFNHAELTRGPKFLRDMGLGEDQFITGTHGGHKGSAIDTILAANPDLQAILMGDTGQHDAEVYLEAIYRHPGRIKAVVLREPGPGPKADVLDLMEKIEAAGTPLYHGPTFNGMAPDAALP